MSDWRAAFIKSGVSFQFISLPGWTPHKCETCLCLLFGSSRSSIHSWSCPCFPIWLGAIFGSISFSLPANSWSVPNISDASMHERNNARIIWWSIVGPATKPPFSGEFEGVLIRYPVFGSLIRNCVKNSAAPFISGKACSARNCLSCEKR